MIIDVGERDIEIKVIDFGTIIISKEGVTIGNDFLPWDFKSNEDIPYDMSWLPKE